MQKSSKDLQIPQGGVCHKLRHRRHAAPRTPRSSHTAQPRPTTLTGRRRQDDEDDDTTISLRILLGCHSACMAQSCLIFSPYKMVFKKIGFVGRSGSGRRHAQTGPEDL